MVDKFLWFNATAQAQAGTLGEGAPIISHWKALASLGHLWDLSLRAAETEAGDRVGGDAR